TDLLRKLRYARQVRNPPNIIGKKLRATLRLQSSFRLRGDVKLRDGFRVNPREPRRLSRSARSRRSCEFRNHAPLGSVALRQCKWNGAHGHKQKQIKCASDKMRV